MANTPFDPFRKDPFASINDAPLIPTQVDPQPQTQSPTRPPLSPNRMISANNIQNNDNNNKSTVTSNDLESRLQRLPRVRSHSPSTLGSRSQSSLSEFGPWEDTAFAPPPAYPPPQDFTRYQLQQKKSPTESLPDYDKIKHSGNCLSRISTVALVTRSWKRIFWVTYGTSEIYFFRNQIHFESWLVNPFLSDKQRKALVKLHIDFEDEAKGSVYKTSTPHKKMYPKGGFLHQFKLEKWSENGPIIVAAFGAETEDDTRELELILGHLIRTNSVNSGRTPLITSSQYFHEPTSIRGSIKEKAIVSLSSAASIRSTHSTPNVGRSDSMGGRYDDSSVYSAYSSKSIRSSSSIGSKLQTVKDSINAIRNYGLIEKSPGIHTH